jgi:hypothetical protein
VSSGGSVHIQQAGAGAVAIDERYLPLVVSCFIGDVNLSLGAWYEKTIHDVVQDETMSERRIVNIHDATHTTRTSPEMRKFWAELSTRNAETVGVRTLHNFIVVSNPIMRGVVTAVTWLNPSVSQIQVFANLQRAVTEASARLGAAGTPTRLPSQGFVYSDEVASLLQIPRSR